MPKVEDTNEKIVELLRNQFGNVTTTEDKIHITIDGITCTVDINSKVRVFYCINEY
jgi:hypothetical protein